MNGRRFILVLVSVLGVALLAAQHRSQAQAPSPLSFFKNYFVTGDYVAGGVGLDSQGVNGFATGSIQMSGAPAGAEVLAAFLYWQGVSSDGPDEGSAGAMFNGIALTSPAGPLAVVANPEGASPCWSSGGGTGAGGGVKRTYTYRADVMRLLPIENGRHRINGAHSVRLPDQGNSNKTPRALGATLVILFRDPDPAAALNAIVMYDGSYTMDNSTGMMSLTMKGFYDPANVAGKMTHIAGSAQVNKNERLVVPGGIFFNAFASTNGASWDTITVPTSPIVGDSVTTVVDHEGFSSFDCLTWGAVIYRTAVNDLDKDGLLDLWESSTSTLFDPEGRELPNLNAMGARPDRKDVFVELGWLDTAAPTPYGGVVKPAHTHRPTAEAIQKLGVAFANAPVLNPDGSMGITLHVDAGPAYPSGVADPFLVGIPWARGGESLDESATVCFRGPADPPWVCQFSDYPGTVGWKSGFRFIRDAWVSDTGQPLDAAAAAACEESGACRRRFDEVRKDMFRYLLFAHALAVPRTDCLANGFPDEACQDTDPLFHVPVTNTGVGDFPGGDGMVTLGAFDDAAGLPVGSDYMQAGTAAHELGHTFWLRHGGAFEEPNCKPNYLSIMNYLFQLRGLRDDLGKAHVDFSSQRLGGLNELGLVDPSGLGIDLDDPWQPPPYRTGWYAPQGPGVFGTPATKHCDGSPLLTDAEGNPIEPPMVRVDSASIADTFNAIDWNLAASQPDPAGQDINFDGLKGALNAGYDDWANLRLNQVGSRRNVGGWYWITDPATGAPVAFLGPLSLDVGRGDLGRGDLGRGDLGRGDLGRGDLGRGDLGRGDLGRGDLGRGDLGRGDLGRGDLGRGDLGRGDLGRGDLGAGDDEAFELDIALAAASGYSPPNEVAASQIGITTACAGLSPADCHRVRSTWSPPNAGTAQRYHLYRVPGAAVTPASQPVLIGSVNAVMGQMQYSLVDGQELPNGQFSYFAVAEFADAAVSGLSNLARLFVINDAPVAANDAYSTLFGTTLNVAAPGVLGNDTDIDSPSLTATLVSGPAIGVLTFNADGSFTYTPAAGFVGFVSFTYQARDVDPTRGSNVATVTIEVRRPVYGFIGVQNLPPVGNKTFNPGSTVPLQWRFTIDGVVVDSSAAAPEITITGPVNIVIRPEDPGSSGFQPPTAANGWTWQYNWQTVHPVTKAPLPSGSYRITITSRLSLQAFDGGTVRLK